MSVFEHGQIGRRGVLRTALAAPAAAPLAALLRAGTAAADTTGGTGGFEADSPRFSIAVLPDTQYLFDADSADPAPLRAAFRYLANHREDANIAFLTHLGDVTEHGTDAEIALASETFRDIDGALPYSVLAGNHDVRSSTDDQRGDTAYLRSFGPQRFTPMPTFGGASPDGYNSYHVLRAGGRQWLVLALDWRASDKGLAWARGVLAAHSALPAILTTHELAYADEAGQATLSAYGRRLWEGIVRGNDQIFLTLNGHYWPPSRTVLRNDAGHDVHVHITNYQDRYYGGAGMIRLYSFDLARAVIDVETFSPWFLHKDAPTPLEAETIELTGPTDRFSLPIDFEARFAGFAPPVLPAPRPARAVVGKGTVAYWRFDAEGLPGARIEPGTLVRDLSGHGNDLTVRRLPGSPADVLTASPEHHRAQPAHASLRFGGGTAPDRGAILEAVPAAPINSATFAGGYTIELFLKLPQPFEGDHAWMGILSWEGRASDAHRASGWSPDEPTCSINLSPERFLQYNVYAADRDVNATSWSHALPTGRWMHVAVVNNSKRSIVHIDGSPIARNPARTCPGIATVGKPFVLGATQFAEAFGQGFYGWLGDVRITARALHPTEFLTA
jgi:3',5'-cyclic AMP phosphodiesterase CpdA